MNCNQKMMLDLSSVKNNGIKVLRFFESRFFDVFGTSNALTAFVA